MWRYSRFLSGPSHQIITTYRGPTLTQYQCYRLQSSKSDFHLIKKKNQQDTKIYPTVSDSAFITYELCVASWKQAVFSGYKYCWQWKTAKEEVRSLTAQTACLPPPTNSLAAVTYSSSQINEKLVMSLFCPFSHSLHIKKSVLPVIASWMLSESAHTHCVFTWAKWVVEWCRSQILHSLVLSLQIK